MTVKFMPARTPVMARGVVRPISPVIMVQWLRYAPLAVVMAYVAFTYFLFLASPFRWPVTNHMLLLLVLCAAMLCFALGFHWGASKPAAAGSALPIKTLVFLGGILALTVLVPSARIYTGKWPWEIAAALADQTKAYLSIGEQLRDTQGQRGLIAFIRAATAPLILIGSTLGIIYWRNLGSLSRFLTLAAFWTSINFSILRGTNREIVDTALLICSSFSIVAARRMMFNASSSATGAKVARFALLSVVILILLYFIIFIFLERVNDRLGVQATLCIGESRICADFNAGVYQFLPYDISRAVGLIAAYLGQGYFGTSLALNEQFVSGLGLGHSPAILSIYQQYVGEAETAFSSYPYMLAYRNWDPAAQWSGMLTWIAADIGFSGAVITMGFFGYLYGRSWVSAVSARNDAAVALFCVLSLTMFYFPGNFQLAIYIDGYAGLISACLLFKLWRPINRGLSQPLLMRR